MASDLGISHTILKNHFRLSRPLTLFKAVLEIRGFLKRQNFSVYNATMPYAHIVTSLAAWGLAIKRTWYQHGPVGGLLDQIASFFKVDQIYFNSQWTKQRHYKTALFANLPVLDAIVPYGIKKVEPLESEVSRIRESQSRGEQTILLLAAGRICPWKSFETVLEGLDNLRRSKKEYADNLKLMVVGDVGRESDRAYKVSLEEFVEEKGLSHMVEFLGQKQDLYNYFRACDIFIHSSSSPEPFGLVVAEAMIQRAFVIGSNQGGTPDVLTDSENGLAFNPTSERAVLNLELKLKQALELKKHNHEKFELLRSNGLRKVENSFNIPSMTHQLEALYKQL
jgi:glycosyltransferase involved in cell wall biosynthesis